MRKEPGYIVLASGHPLWEEARKCAKGDRGVLYYAGRETTVFPTRRAARAAVTRTRRYADRMGYDWDQDYVITKLVPHVG